MRRNNDNGDKVRITIWMPQELKTALLGKAKSCGMPASTIVEKLLEKYLGNVTFEVEVKEILAKGAEQQLGVGKAPSNRVRQDS